jgi:hypothetical protein
MCTQYSNEKGKIDDFSAEEVACESRSTDIIITSHFSISSPD